MRCFLIGHRWKLYHVGFCDEDGKAWYGRKCVDCDVEEIIREL
jgi:hypothetical protein